MDFFSDSTTPPPKPKTKPFTSPPAKNLGDLLDYQRAALQELIFRGGSSDANRAKLRHAMGVDAGGALSRLPGGAGGTYADLGKLRLPAPNLAGGQGLPLGHALQGLADWGFDTASDPLTYETMMMGPAVRGLGKLASAAAPTIARGARAAFGAVRRVNPQAMDFLAHEGTQAASSVRQVARAAGDVYGRVFSYGHPAVREVGRASTDFALAQEGRQGARETELLRRLTATDAAITKGLTPRQLSQVQRVLHGDLQLDQIGNADARALVAKAAAGRRHLMDSIHAMQQLGPIDLSKIPEDLREFAGASGPAAVPYKPNYYPGRDLAKTVEPSRPAREFNLVDYRNPHAQPQEAFTIGRNEMEKFEHAYQGMLATSARAITANELRESLQAHFGGIVPQSVLDLFQKKIPATGEMRGNGQVLADAIRGFVNLPKVAVVGTSPMHMVNILSLLANAGADAVPKTLQRFTQVMAIRDPAARFTFLQPAIDMGLHHGRDGALSRNILGPVSKHLNDATWLWDTVAKWSLADRIAAEKGLSAEHAGQIANRMLVDYDHTSKATNTLKYVMPFATFWSQVPGAVVRGALRNPARSEAVNRLTQGRMLGGGDSESGQYYGPTAAAGRIVNAEDVQHGYLKGAATYVRKGATEPLRAVESLFDKGHFGTYGKSPLDPKYLRSALTNMSPVPFGRDILEVTGGGMFAPEDPLKALFFSGTGYALPKAKAAPKTPSKPMSFF